MPLRSLVFSSDRGTAHLLGEALDELGMEVEHCPEIFGAVERLTLQAFDVIVVDWADEPEASFLLRAARELKSNQPPYPVAVVEAEISVAAAQRAGASHVLVKSRARNDLLEFHNRTWTSPDANVLSDVETGIDSGEAPQRQPPAETFGVANPGEFAPDSMVLSFGGYAYGARTRSRAHRRSKAWPRGLESGHAYKRGIAFTALVVAIFVSVWRLGPVVGPGFRGVHGASIGAKAGALRAFLSTEVRNWLKPSPNESVIEALVAEPLPGNSPMQRRAPALRGSHAPFLAQRPNTPAGAQLAEATTQAPPPSSVFVAGDSLGERIPESLKRPPDLLSLRSVAASFTPSLLGALEPVLVPEEVSRKLLLQKTLPSYPEQALRAGLQGPVVLQAWIGRDGRIRDLKLVRGYLVLGRAAFDAVKQWRYQPYYLNGRAMETQTYITVNFNPAGTGERIQ